MPTTIAEIRNFLALRRIALVGASRDPKDFSRVVLREMGKRGYDIVPVNPAAEGSLDDKRCFARVQDIEPRVDGALVLTAARDTERVVRDCAEAGIRNVWLHRSGGQGSVTQEAVEFCHGQGIHLVEGECPLMFLRPTGLVHHVHAFVRKVRGTYPSEQQRAA